MAKVVRYGVMGAGSINRFRHLPELHANPDAVIAAISDPVRDRVRESAECYGAKPFTDHRKMLADKSLKLDAVVVGTPNALHCPQTLDA